MGIFDNIFDFDGDGEASWEEELLGIEIIEECTEDSEAKTESQSARGKIGKER